MKKDPVTVVALDGGIARVRDVISRGVSKDAIRRAVIAGRLHRPRYGVVAVPHLPGAILRAAQHGGALAGLSAADHHGLWTPPHRQMHLSVRDDFRRPLDSSVRLIRDAHRLDPAERFVVSVQTCVAQCIRILPYDQAVALLDSALHRADRERVDPDELRGLLPRHLHAVLEAADARAEAGAESLVRVRLARRGIRAQPQVWITRGIRVDLLIGDRLVIEIGSEEFHAHPDSYEPDHRRATTLMALGCDVLEFTTRQVMDDWADIEEIIAARAARQ